jgi:hypothetical protein
MKARTILKAIFLPLLAASLFSAPAVDATQKEDKKKQPIEIKGQKVTTRGEEKDPNIKSGSDVNDPNARIDPPPSKGGTLSRGGAACQVRIDNWTSLYIKIFVDGRYRGTVGPWDDAIYYAYPGETRVYGRADYDDGSYVYWGPKLYDCGSDQYIYFKMTK